MAAVDVPDHFKTQEICNKAVRMDQWLLNYVPDWFLKQGQLKTCHDYDDCYGDDDKFVEW